MLVELALFKKVLEHGDDYDYVHLISGQDFPLVPMREIAKECNKTRYDYLKFITGEGKKRYERRLRYWNILVSMERKSKVCAYTRKAFLVEPML